MKRGMGFRLRYRYFALEPMNSDLSAKIWSTF